MIDDLDGRFKAPDLIRHFGMAALVTKLRTEELRGDKENAEIVWSAIHFLRCGRRWERSYATH